MLLIHPVPFTYNKNNKKHSHELCKPFRQKIIQRSEQWLFRLFDEFGTHHSSLIFQENLSLYSSTKKFLPLGPIE